MADGNSLIVGGSVTNSFEQRDIRGDAGPMIVRAQTVANGVIDTVDGILERLKAEGSGSLASAIEAINALGAFKPRKITVTYTPPAFHNISDFIIPAVYQGEPLDGLTIPESKTKTFDWPITDKPVKAPTLQPAALSTAAPPTAPVLASNTAIEPKPPTYGYVAAGTAPGLGTMASLTMTPLTAPTLTPFVMPVLKTITLPTIDYKPTTVLPDIPSIVITLDEQKEYKAHFTILDKPQLMVNAGLIGDAITPREIRESVEVFASRGLFIEPDVLASQAEYATERANLANDAERRRYNIDEILRNAELSRAYLAMLGQLDSLVAEATLQLAKTAFEGVMMQAHAQIELAQAVVQMYNGRVTAFNTSVELYKVMLEAKTVGLQKWKAEVEAEISKTKANAQMGRIYEVQMRAISAQAEVYEGQVQGLMAQIEGFAAQMQSVALESEVARAKLGIYASETDAYAARVMSYKTTFAAYSAKTRGTIATNQLESTKTQASAAQITADAAQVQNAVITMETDAAKLKALAMKNGAVHESVKMKNTIEGLKVGIKASIAKQKVFDWSVKQQITGVKNEAIVENARMAQQYYSAASESAYRASEQTLRAILASTQAAAMAQEAASKTAASVAQGAYSAVHVSAALSGSGRISGDEDDSIRSSLYISDMINYTESREATLSSGG